MTRIFWIVEATFILGLGVTAAGCGPKGPGLTSVAPNTGTVSTIVTIKGSGFAQSGSTNPTVTFTPSSGGSGTRANVISFSTSSLDVQVPSVASAQAAAGTKFNVTVANPKGGSTTLSKAFTMAAPVITDINGGVTGSGTVNGLFVIDGNNFGDLSAAPASGYSVDFLDAASGARVASATVNFANSDWQNIFIVATVPNGLTTSTTYKVTVSTPSGTSAPMDFLVLGSVTFSPSSISWAATSSLPTGQEGFPAVSAPIGATTYLYALGGNTAGSTTAGGKTHNVATVWVNQFDPTTGALANASWATGTALPDNRGWAAAAAASNFNSIVGGSGMLYVMGGLDGTGSATSTVYAGPLFSDGGVGTWMAATALPAAVSAASAVLFHGRIYLAGGNDSSGAPVAHVYSSKIEADGGLDAWQSLSDLPAAIAYHQLISSAGYLYAMGGTTTAGTDPLSNSTSAGAEKAIYDAQINIRAGDLGDGGWIANPSKLDTAREKFTGVVAGGDILVSGGLYGSSTATGSSEEAYATLNTDGTLGNFLGATGSRTIFKTVPGGYTFYNHAVGYFVDTSGKPHVLILGGQDAVTGNPQAGVFYIP